MSNQPIHIRPATPADIEFVVKCNLDMAVETEDKTLDPTTVRAGVATALERPDRCRYFLAELDGVPVGQTAVTFEWSDWRNGTFWWIQSVYVEPGARRRGAFRSLYRHVRDLATREGDGCGVRLYVHRENRGAIDTYRQLGMSLSEYIICEDEW